MILGMMHGIPVIMNLSVMTHGSQSYPVQSEGVHRNPPPHVVAN